MLSNAYLEKNERFRNYIYVLGALILSLVFLMSNLIFNFGIFNIVIMSLSVFLFSLLYEGSIKLKIILTVLVLVLSTTIEIIVLFAMSSVMQMPVTGIVC